MPTNITYPGVYVEELPSVTNTIAAIPTSTTAFIGRAKWGPVNEPTIINSFHEFQSFFGGLWSESDLGYSVMNFFSNGGSEAVIVRLFKESVAEDSPAAKAQINIGDFYFEAANPGTWSNRLNINIDFDIQQRSSDSLKLDVNKMFNLSVALLDEKGKVLRSEEYSNLTIEDKDTEDYRNTLRVDVVLKNQSVLIRYKESKELPADLKSIKSLLDDGAVKYSVNDSIAEIKQQIGKLDEDKKEEKEKLKKKLISLTSSDGERLDSDCFIGPDNEQRNQGIYALEKFINPHVFNLLVISPYNPDDVDTEVVEKAAEYCEMKKAFLILDPPSAWQTAEDARNGLSAIGTDSKNAALYFPRIVVPDPIDNYNPKEVGASGAIAGVYASTDVNSGVWKAPAGTDAVLQGIELAAKLSDNENDLLNPLGINCLRQFPVYGNVVWGARTLQGADTLSSEWKYLNVRRLALYIEKSLEILTKWAVFEPNDTPLWNQLNSSIKGFLSGLYAQGAFVGSSANDAFFVRVDSTTTAQTDIDQGVVNIEVGFAPLKPAEFIVIHIQQIAGQTS